MAQTHHSEYCALRSVIIKPAANAFGSAQQIAREWQALNYLEEPSWAAALEEYQQFADLLQQQGAEVHKLPTAPGLSLDSIYCRDAALVTNGGIILARMGKEARMPEPEALGKAASDWDLPILGRIEAPGTVEGGDVAWIDEHTLAVGRTYRTNDAGIQQLADLLKPLGVKLLVTALPHYQGPSDVFHLMSIFSPVDHNLAVVYSPLMPIPFREELLRRGYQLVEVPAAEFDSMGCNVLALAPRKCLMVAGNPCTQEALEAAGCEVITYAGREISWKGGGGPTCLTRPLLRG